MCSKSPKMGGLGQFWAKCVGFYAKKVDFKTANLFCEGKSRRPRTSLESQFRVSATLGFSAPPWHSSPLRPYTSKDFPRIPRSLRNRGKNQRETSASAAFSWRFPNLLGEFSRSCGSNNAIFTIPPKNHHQWVVWLPFPQGIQQEKLGIYSALISWDHLKSHPAAGRKSSHFGSIGSHSSLTTWWLIPRIVSGWTNPGDL